MENISNNILTWDTPATKEELPGMRFPNGLEPLGIADASKPASKKRDLTEEESEAMSEIYPFFGWSYVDTNGCIYLGGGMGDDHRAKFYITEEMLSRAVNYLKNSGKLSWDLPVTTEFGNFNFRGKRVLIIEDKRINHIDTFEIYKQFSKEDTILYYYELRHGDEFDFPLTIEPHVSVNFWGTLITTELLVMEEEDRNGDKYIELTEEEGEDMANIAEESETLSWDVPDEYPLEILPFEYDGLACKIKDDKPVAKGKFISKDEDPGMIKVQLENGEERLIPIFAINNSNRLPKLNWKDTDMNMGAFYMGVPTSLSSLKFAAIQYHPDRAERMHPDIEEKINAGQSLHHGNAALPEGYVEQNASNTFNKNVDQIRNLHGTPADRAYKSVKPIRKQIQQIEQPHATQLEQMAIQIVEEQMGMENGEVEWDIKLGKRQDIDPTQFQVKNESEPPEIPSQDIGGVQLRQFNEDDIKKEVDKRRILNSMTQGAAQKAKNMFFFAQQQLNQIDPRLVQLYKKFIPLTQFRYWTKGDPEDNEMPQIGGATSVSMDGEEGKPVIHATATTFVVLLAEMVKGVMELLAMHGLPQEEEIIPHVYKQTEDLKNERWDIRFGQNYWDKLLEAMNIADPRTRAKIYEQIVKLPADEFNTFIKGVLSGSPEAKQKIQDMSEGISAEGSSNVIEPDKYYIVWNDNGVKKLVDGIPYNHYADALHYEVKFRIEHSLDYGDTWVRRGDNMDEDILSEANLRLAWDIRRKKPSGTLPAELAMYHHNEYGEYVVWSNGQLKGVKYYLHTDGSWRSDKIDVARLDKNIADMVLEISKEIWPKDLMGIERFDDNITLTWDVPTGDLIVNNKKEFLKNFKQNQLWKKVNPDGRDLDYLNILDDAYILTKNDSSGDIWIHHGIWSQTPGFFFGYINDSDPVRKGSYPLILVENHVPKVNLIEEACDNTTLTWDIPVVSEEETLANRKFNTFDSDIEICNAIKKVSGNKFHWEWLGGNNVGFDIDLSDGNVLIFGFANEVYGYSMVNGEGDYLNVSGDMDDPNPTIKEMVEFMENSIKERDTNTTLAWDIKEQSDMVTVTEEDLKELKRLYNTCPGGGSFTFKDREVLKAYAKYLIEYLDIQFNNKRSEANMERNQEIVAALMAEADMPVATKKEEEEKVVKDPGSGYSVKCHGKTYHHETKEDANAQERAIQWSKHKKGSQFLPKSRMAADISDQVPPMGWENDESKKDGPAGAGMPLPPNQNLQNEQPTQNQKPADANVLYDSGQDSGPQFQTTVNPKDKSVTVKFVNSPEEEALNQAIGTPPGAQPTPAPAQAPGAPPAAPGQTNTQPNPTGELGEKEVPISF